MTRKRFSTHSLRLLDAADDSFAPTPVEMIVDDLEHRSQERLPMHTFAPPAHTLTYICSLLHIIRRRIEFACSRRIMHLISIENYIPFLLLRVLNAFMMRTKKNSLAIDACPYLPNQSTLPISLTAEDGKAARNHIQGQLRASISNKVN